MEVDLNTIMKHIRLLENMKECYQVKLYYSGSKSSGLTEAEQNELTLQNLLTSQEIETISFKLAELYNEYDRVHHSLINYKTNSSMNNDTKSDGTD